MSSQRPSFAKRDREMKLKDKARQKAARRLQRRTEPRTGHGPPIAEMEPPPGMAGPDDVGMDDTPDEASDDASDPGNPAPPTTSE